MSTNLEQNRNSTPAQAPTGQAAGAAGPTYSELPQPVQDLITAIIGVISTNRPWPLQFQDDVLNGISEFKSSNQLTIYELTNLLSNMH